MTRLQITLSKSGSSATGITAMIITESPVLTLINGKQDMLTAGTGITISGSTISASLPFPTCPTTTDGQYMLVATVSSGSVAYTWQAVATASGNSF